MIGVLVPGHAQLVALRGVAVGAVTSEVLKLREVAVGSFGTCNGSYSNGLVLRSMPARLIPRRIGRGREFMNCQVAKTTGELRSLVIAMVAQISLPESQINGVRIRGDQIRHRGVAKTGGKS